VKRPYFPLHGGLERLMGLPLSSSRRFAICRRGRIFPWREGQVEPDSGFCYAVFMMNSTLTEAHILEQVVMSDQPGMSPESARAILDLRFDPSALSRMNELGEKNRLGTLAESERQEMDKYVRVGNFLNLMQAKARLCLPPGA
jgi:hypothetical protein